MSVVDARPVLGPEQWQPLAEAHERRARTLLADVIVRRARGERHPVEDFMFDYYRLRPGQLVEWHPGVGVRLRCAASAAAHRYYREEDGLTGVDAPAFVASRGSTLRFTRELLVATGARQGQFNCFGMHEWAMVYGLTPDQTRHSGLPLRFAPDRIREVVNENGLRCTHYDAFRFFTEDAAPQNAHQLTRADQVRFDQPGCLHATMDLYKYAGKLLPLTSSELLLDCYDLALEIRELDMRASAYDLSGWGYEPVAVETPEGKATYVRMQRGFSERGQVLRRRLLDVIDQATDLAGASALRD